MKVEDRMPFALLFVLLLACGSSSIANEGSALARTVDSSGPDRSWDGRAKRFPRSTSGKTRIFRFHYAGAINQVTPGSSARVWIPVASNSHDQSVEIQSIRLPADYSETRETKFGNRLIYFEAVANDQGEIPFHLEYLVRRKELLAGSPEPVDSETQGAFLRGSSLVPVDASLRKRLLDDEAARGEALEVARRLYDAVDGRMKYDKPTNLPWGRGDAVWACDSGVGNCTDFHSLFIAVSINLGIAAKFEIGFPVPAEVGSGPIAGYHCWAKFADGKHWRPVDISEADKHPELREYYFGNLSADRVAFTVGRDLVLVPPNRAGPVNFLVYPYVEIDGLPHESFVKNFRYEDVQ
jgi:transglutaminase-like putative cysteine protease